MDGYGGKGDLRTRVNGEYSGLDGGEYMVAVWRGWVEGLDGAA